MSGIVVDYRAGAEHVAEHVMRLIEEGVAQIALTQEDKELWAISSIAQEGDI